MNIMITTQRKMTSRGRKYGFSRSMVSYLKGKIVVSG